VVLVDQDPLGGPDEPAAAAQALRDLRVSLTVVDGRVVHSDL
jgi:hypothetical protein